MAIQILTPDKIVSAGLARWGIYGDNGTGKTTLLASVDPSLKMLVVSGDSENVKPLLARPNTFIIKVKKWDDIYEIAQALRSPQNPFQVCAWDTWTRMQALAFNKIARNGLTVDSVELLKAAPKTKKGWDVYEDVGTLAGDGMRVLLETPVHQIFLFQEETQNLGKVEDDIRTGPALTKAALRVARDSLEMIGRLYVVDEEDAPIKLDGEAANPKAINPNRQEKRMLLIGKHDRFFTKGPSHLIGYVVENPTWEKLSPAWRTNVSAAAG